STLFPYTTLFRSREMVSQDRTRAGTPRPATRSDHYRGRFAFPDYRCRFDSDRWPAFAQGGRRIQLSFSCRHICAWPLNQPATSSLGSFRNVSHHSTTHLRLQISSRTRTDPCVGSAHGPSRRGRLAEYRTSVHCHVLDVHGLVATPVGDCRCPSRRRSPRNSDLEPAILGR